MKPTLDELEAIVERLTRRVEELESLGPVKNGLPNEEFIKEQRKFLHDISSPVSIAQGMVEICVEQLEKDSAQPMEVERLKKALKALQKITSLIQQNREKLIMSA